MAVAVVLFVLVLTTPMTIGATLLYIGLALSFWFTLAASIHAWSIATGDARTRAGSFALAFGVRDLCWGVVYGAATLGIWRGTMAIEPTDPDDPLYLIYLLGTLLAVPLIAYGILRAHLFDIDLRIRWTIKQSTLGAMIAAALVMFFLAPLQRFADRVASAAMPNTHNTPEYAAFRKLQVYEAAVAEALLGGISDKERVLLNRLRDSLGVSTHEAETIEREVNERG